MLQENSWPTTLLALSHNVPFIAFAQDATDVLTTITDVIEVLIPIIIGIAVVVFLWGVITRW